MPKLFVYDTGRRITTKVTLAFARGAVNHNCVYNGPWIVKHLGIQRYLDNGLPADFEQGDSVATLGILRGTGLLLKEAIEKGIDYYYMDHAYFNAGYGGKGWMRVTKNGHSCNTLRDVPKDRFKSFAKNYGIKIEPWRTNRERGALILVLPPTNAVSWFHEMNPYAWERRVVGTLKEILPRSEHHRIVVRHKPKEPIVDKRGFLLELQPTAEHEDMPSLADQLDEACCVIAYNSMVALEATLKGIPVITSPHSCCDRVSFSIDDFYENSKPTVFNTEPLNRKHLIYWLAHNQWKMRDIEDGKCWKELQEIYSGV